MNPETETNVMLWYCKAGFGHAVGDKCEHIVKIPTASSKRPATNRSAFYSEEAMAQRREENRKKYGPKRRGFGSKFGISPGVNQAYELTTVGGKPEPVGDI